MTRSVSTAELAALGCAVLWAINGLLLRTQADRIPPATMNATRCAVAGLLFLLLLPFDASPGDLLRVPPAELGLLAASVIIGIAVGDTLYLVALKEIVISRAIALSGIYPLTTMAWEAVLLHRLPGSNLVVGAVLVAAGVVLLSRPAGPPPPSRPPERLKLGIGLSLVAAVAWGLSSVLLKPAIAHLSLIQANAARMPMVALFLFLFRILPSRRESLRAFDLTGFLVVAATGLLGMGVGAYLFLYAIENAPVAKTVTLTATAPFFGLILGALFLRERLTVRLVLGMASCMGGVWAVV